MIVVSPEQNHFLVHTNTFIAYQSNSTLVAVMKHGRYYVTNKYQFFNDRTRFHFNTFIGLQIASTTQFLNLIDDGTITVLNDIDLHNLCTCNHLEPQVIAMRF